MKITQVRYLAIYVPGLRIMPEESVLIIQLALFIRLALVYYYSRPIEEFHNLR